MITNIISFNVRGLRCVNKRRAIFDFYRNKCDILCLQETHSTSEDEVIWSAEWGGKILYSHGTSASRGTAILFKNKQLNCEENINEKDGRATSCVITVDGVRIMIICIYGPNDDSPMYFDKLIKDCYTRCENLVIIGDFNTVMNHTRDRTCAESYSGSRGHIHPKSSEKLNQLCEELILQDIWRVRNPEANRYSWYRKNKNKIQASRLDYALISHGIANCVHDTFYLNGLQSDHSAFFLGVEVNKVQRGPSFWKLNTSKLCDQELLKLIKEEIRKTVIDYSELEPQNKWEVLKHNIRTVCQKYCKASNSEERIAIAQLSEAITEYEDRVQELTEEEDNLLLQSKIDLEELQAKRTASLIFRSKAKWYAEGEINTKYFLNLEKSKYNAKTCTAVFNDKNQLISDQKQVLEIQRQFYQKLYTADESVKFDLELEAQESVTGPGANNEQLSLDEIAQAVQGLKNGSCPGPDGIPVELYKMMWREVKHPLYDAVCSAFENNIFHDTARCGILNLIPKGSKDTRYLPNLRPITLLNCDYKIVEKAVANRMVPSLDYVISNDQTGFLPGRQIASNIRKLFDLIHTAHLEQEEYLILSCDFMKCFDRIEINSVIKAMEHFGFAPTIVRWVRIMYTKFSLKVQNAGFFSHRIETSRGVHQGGPLSNAIFLTVAELVAQILRADPEIDSAWIKKVKQLLNQFADNMDISIKNNQHSLSRVIQHLENFRASTGFTLNYDKTTVLRVGSIQNADAKLYTPRKLQWTNDSINVLGVQVSAKTTEQVLNGNYLSVMSRSQQIL